MNIGVYVSFWFMVFSGHMGFPGNAGGKEPACQCRRYKRLVFDPWAGKIPWKRAQQSTPVFLPGESQAEKPGGLQSIESHRVGHDWSDLVLTHAGYMPSSGIAGSYGSFIPSF